ncbi:MAG: hypothetical protein Q8R69_09280 [Telluria sp.]|nr:hypothetical protein [Telluria sp.]
MITGTPLARQTRATQSISQSGITISTSMASAAIMPAARATSSGRPRTTSQPCTSNSCGATSWSAA